MSLLTEQDARDIVRLVGETASLDLDLPKQRRHLMTGLCRMLKADAWVWTHAVGFEPGELPVYAGYTYGGFSKDEFARFLKINFHPDMARLTAPLAADLQEKKMCHHSHYLAGRTS